ncbi:DNA polymerase I [Abditibacteriota bacterium]|nr:DNA polymerase I [Abditibacteriota bacterium]
MSKLLLIDGYSLLYRAFFSSPPFSTSAGEPTGALYGFVRMVTRLLDENAPDYVVVAFDPPGGTFRHEADATYKAQRSDAPDDLKIQQRLVRELLDGLSIPRYEHKGFEADDVIGTLAKRGEEDGHDVLIITGDGDQLQLATERVQVLLTRKGVSELEAYKPAEVVARYGFEPKYVPDFKGLKGDASDNIPGIPGIGDKTASALLQKFGSLDGIYEHLDEVTPPRIQGLLREHQAQSFHSRTMATIVCDLPVEAEPEDFKYDPFDPEKRRKAADTARRFEFKSLVARYETPTAGTKAAPAPAKELEFTLEETDSIEAVQKWIKKQKNAPIALALYDDGWMLAHDGKVIRFDGEAGHLKSFLEDEKAPKIVHDEKSLMRALAHVPTPNALRPEPSLFDEPETEATEGGQGVEIKGVIADTMLMAYLLEPTRQNPDIEFIAQKFLRYALPPLPETPKKRGKDASLFDEGPREEEIAQKRKHQAASVAVLDELEPVLRHELDEIDATLLLNELELPLVPVLASIERVGMQLDPGQLRELDKKLQADIAQSQQEVWVLAGHEFSIGSTKQLQEVLYNELKLDTGRKNKSGGFTTDVFTLERLADEGHEIARKILDWRQSSKLKSTYVDALLKLMDPQTHRIHSTLNQTGAVSGRLSSTDPNLQNVPIRTEQGRLIRKAFVAPAGRVVLSADYSQIELRILAHITNDAPLVDAFQNGEDVHARTASALFGVKVEEVDREMRRKAKMTNYAIAYGVSGFGLAKQLGSGSHAGEAQEFIKTYFETLPGVKKYIDDTLEEGRKCGYVETLLGRRRPVPDLNANAFQIRSAAERTAINHPIQGTSADVMKMAMIAIARELRERGLKSSLTMQVHDELVFEVPTEEIEEVTDLVKDIMARVPVERLKLKVPLLAEVGTGPNWEDTKAGKE